MDGSEPGIPGTSAVFASAFQVIEEETNEGRVEILDPELGGHFAESFFGKLQKQAEAIAISRDRMRARLPLAKQAIGKEGLKKRGKAGGNHGCTSRCDQPVGSQLKKFGHGFQVPIGIVHVDVPQVGGQLGEFSFDIEPGAIPVDQGADGKSVSHVMQPWTAAVTLGRCAEAELLGELGEGVSSRPLRESDHRARRRKNARSGWCRKEAISSFGVLFQSLYRGGMNRHVTRFSKLRPPDVKDSAIEVDIRSVQAEGFVHPHPRRHQQTEESRKGAGAESLGRGELLGSAKEPFDLLVAIDVRRLASVTMREKAWRWNLGARFGGTVPNGEAPDHTQTPSPSKRLSLRGLGGPAKRQFRGDVRGTLGLEKRNKIPQ